MIKIKIQKKVELLAPPFDLCSYLRLFADFSSYNIQTRQH